MRCRRSAPNRGGIAYWNSFVLFRFVSFRPVSCVSIVVLLLLSSLLLTWFGPQCCGSILALTAVEVHEELLHPLVHDLVVAPPPCELAEEELVVLVAERRQDRVAQVPSDNEGGGRAVQPSGNDDGDGDGDGGGGGGGGGGNGWRGVGWESRASVSTGSCV